MPYISDDELQSVQKLNLDLARELGDAIETINLLESEKKERRWRMTEEYVVAVGAKRELNGKLEIKCFPLIIDAKDPSQATGYAYVYSSKQYPSEDGWMVWVSPPQTLTEMRKIKRII